ncbi:hypothetical protein [Reichenbachiella sp. MALMAid0571]|uniref:hypothetical protein n=1 Tax=Reichenbachiella sp. MALMAid0571 TaxID=3143939 RepID=UPI0032E031CE
MKKIALLSIILIGFLMSAYAQEWMVESYMERTHISTKIGTSVGLVLSGNIKVGAFYQKHANTSLFQEEELPHLYEEHFKGIYFSYPIKQSKIFELDMKIRTGLTNVGFIITPSFHAYVEPIRKVRLGLGLGMRMLRPTVQPSISITL